MTGQPNLSKQIWTTIKAHLESRKDSINQQIESYPTPIAGCDDQFNYLLQQRVGISAELTHLTTQANESSKIEDATTAIDQFLETSTFIDDEEKQSIRQQIRRDAN